jgi:hypothetical protein
MPVRGFTAAGAGVVAALAAIRALSGQPAPAPSTPPAAPPRYSHAQHAKLEVDHRDCGACHSLGPGFAVEPPIRGKDHRPCSDARCHAAQFFSRAPTICGVCHDAAEPWVAQPAVVRDREPSEFGGSISHRSHATAELGAGGVDGACVECHGDPYAGTPAPTGHDTCAPCHGRTAAPAMASCGGCHTLGGPRGGGGAQPDSGWSVAARFSHRDHGRDPRSKGRTACVECHATVAKAERADPIPHPAMASCDGCHDGQHAFKTTGFDCHRCHGGAEAKR